nr:MAG TPA: hypothetical protein [Caudoviricetes sp.]
MALPTKLRCIQEGVPLINDNNDVIITTHGTPQRIEVCTRRCTFNK